MNNQFLSLSLSLCCSFLGSSRLVRFQRIDYDSIIILSQQSVGTVRGTYARSIPRGGLTFEKQNIHSV